MRKYYYISIIFMSVFFFGNWAAYAQSAGQLYMGFTPWPYDLTEEAVRETYEFISKNGNLVAHHLDNGVPWQEALDNDAYPEHLKQEWSKRIANTPKGHKVFLALTPISFSRDAISPYWGESGDNLPLPKSWKGRQFNDQKVKKAFLNYTLRAVGAFKPDFLAIGIESNLLITNMPHKWKEYLELNAYVYEQVKKHHPSLPVFSTIQYEHLRGIEDESKANLDKQIPGVKKLMQHSDYLALSTYRYGFIHPNPPDDDYFEPAMQFGKKIAIAETGAMSETTLVMGLPLIASEGNQKEFISMVLKNARKHNFAFVVNWVSRDFDPMIKKLPSEFRSIAKAWVHTGLVDADGEEKAAFAVWKKYLHSN